MPSLESDALFVVLPGTAPIRRQYTADGYTKNDRAGNMAAVQRADPAHQTVIEFLIGRVAVLQALYRLMIRGTVGVCGDLPAVTAEGIVVLLADLLPSLGRDRP